MLKILQKIFKKPTLTDSISERIIELRKKGVNFISINFWIDDQILFQNGTGIHFEKYGVEIKDANEIFAIHFFNKDKSLTIRNWNTFKNMVNTSYVNFQTEDGNDFYVKSMGISPTEIMNNIKREIEIYEVEDKSRIGIQFVEN